jgi:hypothetical protein
MNKSNKLVHQSIKSIKMAEPEQAVVVSQTQVVEK